MIGHQALIDMRINKQRPHMVFFDIDEEPNKHYTEWQTFKETVTHAKILIEKHDVISNLDLRFVIRLPIVIKLGKDYRKLELFEQCKKYKATRVVTVVNNVILDSLGRI